MSRKKTQPKKNIVPDPKFKSTIIPKLINSIMFDGKKGVAQKIVYEAIDKIKTMKTCGITVTDSPADIGKTLKSVLNGWYNNLK